MEDLVKRIDQLKIKYETLKKEIARKIVGQEEIIDKILVAIFSNGHCLLIGVPGLAKTLMVTAISETLDLKYKRIQFTPDLMPSDIIGTEILNNQKEFRFIEGPLFANIILADEINRTPPKTQSALLEAMQEQEITATGTTRKLEQPFFVLATQNPIEQEGTYPLPEAQMDRFMLKTVVGYPTKDDEQRIMRRNTSSEGMAKIRPVVSLDDIRRGREAAKEVYMDEKIEKYILDIVFATRYPEEYKLDKLKPLIAYGASPRGSINLVTASKVYAFLRGRGYVIPEDVRAIAPDVLRHRIGVTYEAEAENVRPEEIISTVINEVQVP